jgi:hypothetical protein
MNKTVNKKMENNKKGISYEAIQKRILQLEWMPGRKPKYIMMRPESLEALTGGQTETHICGLMVILSTEIAIDFWVMPEIDDGRGYNREQ